MSSSTSIGSTLVTGGSGFVGYHIVQSLLQEPRHGPIHIASRHPQRIFGDRVQYHSFDLSNTASVDAKLREIQPSVVFHVASPRDTEHLTYEAYRRTNVTGTLNILSSAARIPAIRALVFTSSAGVIGGFPVVDADENAPKCDEPPFKPSFYHRTKAEAERLVLEIDQSKLATVSLRLCLVYGERDNQLLPALLKAYYNGQTNIQLGNNKNSYDFVYAGNAAHAHVRAAKALLDPKLARGNVKGEAFLITDGHPRRFWDAAHVVWRAAGDQTRYDNVFIIPAWFALFMAYTTEWLYWVFTFGRRTPQQINLNTVAHATHQHTYNIAKARERLGYDPVPDFEGGLQRAVVSYIEEFGEDSKNR